MPTPSTDQKINKYPNYFRKLLRAENSNLSLRGKRLTGKAERIPRGGWRLDSGHLTPELREREGKVQTKRKQLICSPG